MTQSHSDRQILNFAFFGREKLAVFVATVAHHVAENMHLAKALLINCSDHYFKLQC